MSDCQRLVNLFMGGVLQAGGAGVRLPAAGQCVRLLPRAAQPAKLPLQGAYTPCTARTLHSTSRISTTSTETHPSY